MFDDSQASFVELRNIVSERSSPIIVWVGAGASREVGAPTWPELANALQKAFLQKCEALTGVERKKGFEVAASIENVQNMWQKFQRYYEELGPATYRSTIRERIGAVNSCGIPEVYRKLWALPSLRGLLNLNIDRLATRAYTETFPGQVPIEFNGLRCGDHAKHLSGPHLFVANLHGNYEDDGSWVFTRNDLNNLIGRDGYKTFLDACLTAFRIVFVGISTDDLAVGGHLERLAKAGVTSGPHFWITHRTDRSTDQYAENLNVRCITYPHDASHTGLYECLDSLRSHVPDEDNEPVEPAFSEVDLTETGELPAPQDLVSVGDPEIIREKLNSYAIHILADESVESRTKYEEFCDEYDQAIHQAWFVSLREGRNRLLGHELIEEIGNGAFSTVYRAKAIDGREVALKLLRQDVRNDPRLLHSFRRGVRSMRILSNRKVAGMVAYKEASEIPTFVTMELVEGPDLKEAVEAHQFRTWGDILWVASEIASIVRVAHNLPERILHRDLRPANVMIRSLYTEPDEAEVVVLDFDLSWHKGAVEKSVYHPSMLGYLAPEQVRYIKGTSTRSALVDSFGLGMTLFFLISREEALAESHARPEWEERVNTAASKIQSCGWKSIGARFSRLILECTQEHQNARPDSSAIEYELATLQQVVAGDPEGVTADLLAEEVVARSGYCGAEYSWNVDEAAARIDLPSGVRLRVSGRLGEQVLYLVADWEQAGSENRRKVGKWIGTAADSAKALLQTHGWSVVGDPEGRGVIHLEASRAIDPTDESLSCEAETLDEVVQKLRFE